MTETGASEARVAIITGGSGGIGSAVASRLAAEDMQVIVNYNGNKERADQVVTEVQAAGGQASALEADIADYGQT